MTPKTNSVPALICFIIAGILVISTLWIIPAPLLLSSHVEEYILVEHHVLPRYDDYGKPVPLSVPVNMIWCCFMVPSKLPDNATLESVRMQRGSAYTTLLYSDGLKIIQGPGYGLPRVMELLEGSPGVYRFLYADAEGIGHDPWIERLTNGTNIRHKGYLGFWRDEPLWLSELIGDRSSAELREIAISMLQSLKGRPVPDEMRGRSVSLSEASELAKMAGFRIRLPTQLPAQFQLMDVRVAEFPPRIDLNQTHPKINARLIYSATPLPANATSLDLLKSGGFILNLKERIVVGEFEALYKLFRGREENSTTRKITIRGNEGIYFA